MLGFHSHQRFFIYTDDTDMRRGYDGLSGLVRNEIASDPSNGDVYVFFNKQRNKIKLLVWDLDGFAIYSKRLEKGRFEKINATNKKHHIRYDHLIMLLSGMSLEKSRQRKRFNKL